MQLKANIVGLFFIFVFTACGIVDSDDNYNQKGDKVYVALQGLDQVGIVNINSEEIDVIDINYATVSCMDYESEMDCNMASDCNWIDMGTMSHCMDEEDNCTGLNEFQCDIDGCEWMMNMCMESGGIMDMGNQTPHFIVIDEINKYWFVTNITSGLVGRYDLETNTFIDKIFVGDSPALMALNNSGHKLYISRMMPMGSMMTGSISTVIQEIDYSDSSKMELSNEFSIDSPAPHGLAINSIGTEVYVASNTADWLWKIIPSTEEVEGKIMDASIGNSPDIVTQRLKPIQITSVDDSLLLVSCSGGIWINPYTQEQDTLPGLVQLWNSNTLTLLDTIQFNWESTPWHIAKSTLDRKVYVVLGGDILFSSNMGVATAGVACLTFEANKLNIKWKTLSESFETLHGIGVSSDGEKIYVSGRKDGNLHVFNSGNGELEKSIPLGNNPLAGGLQVYSSP